MTFEEWQEQEGFSEDYDLVRYCYEAGEKNATAAERERFMPLVSMLWGSRAVTGMCPVCGAVDDKLTGRLKCNEDCELNALIGGMCLNVKGNWTYCTHDPR